MSSMINLGRQGGLGMLRGLATESHMHLQDNMITSLEHIFNFQYIYLCSQTIHC